MISIVLHGILRKKFGKEYTLSVSTTKEAIVALSSQLKGFRQTFLMYDYKIYSDINGSKTYILDSEIAENLICDNLHIVPAIKGGKSNTQKGVGKIVIAAALFFIAGPAGDAVFNAIWSAEAASTALAVADAVSTTLTAVATATLLNGITSILTPKVKTAASADSKQVSGDSTANNIVVPVAYGQAYFDVIPVSVEVASTGIRGTSFVHTGDIYTGDAYSG